MWSLHRSLGPIIVGAFASLVATSTTQRDASSTTHAQGSKSAAIEVTAGQDKRDQDSSATPTQAQLEARYLAADPGVEHERLVKLAGKWIVDVRQWTRPEDRKAIRWKAVAEGRDILGRRFVEIRIVGKHGKRKIEELLLLGFDRRRGVYTLNRLSTDGTHILSADGKWSRELKQIAFEGVDDDPTLGRRERFRYDLRQPNEHEFRLYRTVYGHSKDGFRNLVVIARRTQ